MVKQNIFIIITPLGVTVSFIGQPPNLPPLFADWTWASVEQLAAPEPNSITDVVTANLQRVTRLRQSILQKAFTGELC